jgi:predicted nucleotidyltransferase/DNA-binding transcriptional ArsR family regulator
MRLSQPLDDLLQSRSHIRVLRALQGLPAGLDVSIREIARRAGVSHPTASTVLESLRQQGLVHVRRTLLANEYRLNDDHVVVSPLRQFLIWEGDLGPRVKAFLVESIQNEAPWVSAAYLFGSAVRDDMKPASDLDMALICPPNKVQRLQKLMDELGEETAARFGNRLNVVIGTRPINELAKPRQPSYRLWRSIWTNGEQLLPTPKAE